MYPYHVQNFHYLLESIYVLVALALNSEVLWSGLLSGRGSAPLVFLFFRILIAFHIYFSMYPFASICTF